MSSRPGSRPGRGYRWYRQKMIMDDAVIARRHETREIVYGYRFPSCPGRMKIGYSSRGLDRVAEQSTAFPEKPELVFVIHDRDARRIEEAFHMALADRQSDVMGTEWFDVVWRDVLRVSPHLRRASGVDGRGVRIRIALAVLVGVVMALVYPAVAVSFSGVVMGVPLADIAQSVGVYLSEIGDLSLMRAWGMAQRMIVYSWSRDIFWMLPVGPVILVCLPVLVPFWRWRRQAA